MQKTQTHPRDEEEAGERTAIGFPDAVTLSDAVSLRLHSPPICVSSETHALNTDNEHTVNAGSSASTSGNSADTSGTSSGSNDSGDEVEDEIARVGEETIRQSLLTNRVSTPFEGDTSSESDEADSDNEDSNIEE